MEPTERSNALWIGFITAVFALATPLGVLADASSANSMEIYPESHFGSGPAKADTGTVRASWVRKHVDEDEDNADSSGVERGIASVGGDSPSGSSKGRSIPQSPVADTGTVGSVGSNSDLMIPKKAGGPQGVQELSLIASDLGFFPKMLFVTRDTPVRIYVTGASKSTLCIIMDTFQVRRQLRSQKIEEISFVPTIPGKYRYYCPVNGGEGYLVVRELAASLERSQ